MPRVKKEVKKTKKTTTKTAKVSAKKSTAAKTKKESVKSSCLCGCADILKKIPVLKNIKCSAESSYVLMLILFVLIVILFVLQGTSSSRYESSVEKWVNENPEKIIESVNKFVMEKQKEIVQQRRQAASGTIKTRLSEIQNTKYSGVVNPRGTVTVVEFFDYNCGYCKQVSRSVERLAKENKDVRVIFKELPILGASSKYAAQVGTAIAIKYPGKYMAFHSAMMEGNARTAEGVKQAVKKAGLNFSSVKQVLNSESAKIEKALSSNIKLATEIGVEGTPALIVGEEFVPGALSYEDLKNLVEKAKK